MTNDPKEIIAGILAIAWVLFVWRAHRREQALDKYEDERWLLAKEFYGSQWASAIIECNEAHLLGDCPLCGRM